MDESAFSVAVDRLHFAEGPRWHDGSLWFSDMYGHRVMRYRPGSEAEEVLSFPGDKPSGLGWLPDGRLLFVVMDTRRVMRLDGPGRIVVHADLSPLCRGFANDMIVAPDGTAYVDDSGLPNIGQPGERQPGQLIRVTPDGSASRVADDLVVPNGCILTDDARTLIVAEAHAGHLTAFDVGTDGQLSGRRLFAKLVPASAAVDRVHPDGICLDAEGAVWAADIAGMRMIRVHEGGRVSESATFSAYTPIACVLGGDDRRTLFVCARRAGGAARMDESADNCVLAGQVAVGGAGRP
jgi:sugar lactone lactonase YvrE